MKTEQWELIMAEVRKYPGVTYRVVTGGKHSKLQLEFEGRTCKRPFSRTSVDWHGMRNNVTVVRRMLRELGAKRNA